MSEETVTDPTPNKRVYKKKPNMHTHGPSFGRYVEGCLQCQKVFPEGPAGPRVNPIRKRDRGKFSTKQLSGEQMARLREQLREDVRRELAAESKLAADNAPPPAPDVPRGTFLTSEQLAEAMRVLGTELRRPDPEVEAAKAAEKIRKERAREDEIKVIMEQKALREAEQSACNHKQPNGQSRVRGQIHNDNLFHPLCTWCMKEFPPRALSQSERSAMGMS